MRNLLMWVCPLAIAATAGAAPLCVTGTLSSYESMAAACSVGSYTFSEFHFSAAGSIAVNPAAVQVQVVDTSAGQGLSFTGPFSATAGHSLDALISFLISAPVIPGETLAIQNANASGGANAQVVETVCESGVAGCGGFTPAALNAFVNPSASVLSESTTFSGLAAAGQAVQAQVMKNIIVQGGSAGTSDRASIGTVLNTLPVPGGSAGPGGGPTTVPEPDTMILLGSALVGGALLLRRRKV